MEEEHKAILNDSNLWNSEKAEDEEVDFNKLGELTIACRKPISEYLHRRSKSVMDVPVYQIDLK
jgi:hypothetical protein